MKTNIAISERERVEAPSKNRRLKNWKSFLVVVFFVVGLFASTHYAYATTYYVKATGSDSNTGLSDAQAWQTLSKVRTVETNATIKAGDTILFNRGDTFAGYLTPKVNGTSNSPVTWDAYGSGANPLINATGISSGIDIRSVSYRNINNLDIL